MSTLGRPRSSTASKAILEAVLDLVAEHGSIAAVSVDAVAARSGASKATIYRRWSSKEELVAAAVDSLKSPPDLELPHESVRDDLVRLGRSVRTDLTEQEKGVLRCVSVEAHKNPELGEQQDRFMARRRDATRALFDYWVERGALRDDIDTRLAGAMFISPILMTKVYGHFQGLTESRLVEDLVDHLLAGIQAPPGDAASG